MSTLLERISAADDMEEYEVDVPEWGVAILLITPSMETRSKLMEAQISARRDIPEGESADDETAALRRIDMNQMQFSVIQACAFDPADKTVQLFLPENTDTDLKMLGAKNGKVVWTLFEACQKLAGLSGDSEDVVDEGKDG